MTFTGTLSKKVELLNDKLNPAVAILKQNKRGCLTIMGSLVCLQRMLLFDSV